CPAPSPPPTPDSLPTVGLRGHPLLVGEVTWSRLHPDLGPGTVSGARAPVACLAMGGIHLGALGQSLGVIGRRGGGIPGVPSASRSEEHTSELQSRFVLV